MRLTRGLRGGGSLSLLSCSCSSSTGLRSQYRLIAAPKVSAFSLLLYRNWTQQHREGRTFRVCRPATFGVAVVHLKCEIRDGVGLVKPALFDSDFSWGVRHGQEASIQCGGLRRDRYPKKRPASTKGRNVGCGRITHSHVVRRTTENGTSWKFAAGWTGAAHATGIGRGASEWRTIKPLT